jgi:hypothetical protein
VSIAVACTVPDGVVIGADSAITVAAPGGGVLKVFEDAEKVFPLCSPGTRMEECFLGAATFGLGTLGARTVGAYVREFCSSPEGADLGESSVEQAAHAIGDSLSLSFAQEVQPIAEKVLDKPFGEIPVEQRPSLGLAVAGFSPGSHLPELWGVQIPGVSTGVDIARYRKVGEFGATWWGVMGPITRFVKGFDLTVLDQVADYLHAKFGLTLSEEDWGEVSRVVAQAEWQIPFEAMPVQEAVNITRFLLGLAINFVHFGAGAPICGGPVRAALITRSGGFQWVQRPEVEVRQL